MSHSGDSHFLPRHDLVLFAPDPSPGETELLDGSALQASHHLLPLDRPLPYRLPDGPLWLLPALGEWHVARRNLETLKSLHRPAVLLAAERSLSVPGAMSPGDVLACGHRLALSLAGLKGKLGPALQRFAAALLADPGVHLLVSLSREEAGLSRWKTFEPADYGMNPGDFKRLTATNWEAILAGEPVHVVRAEPAPTGLFARFKKKKGAVGQQVDGQ